MTDKNTELDQEQVFDPLDMNNYKVEKLPKMEKSGFEKWMARLGGPVAALVFILIYWVIDIPLFDNLDFSGLSSKAQARLGVIGEAAFIRACYGMLAIFCASIVLWITEAVQSYLTSLMVILAIVLCGITTQKEAFAGDVAQHPVFRSCEYAREDPRSQEVRPVVRAEVRQERIRHILQFSCNQCGAVDVHFGNYGQGHHPAAYIYGRGGDFRRQPGTAQQFRP